MSPRPEIGQEEPDAPSPCAPAELSPTPASGALGSAGLEVLNAGGKTNGRRKLGCVFIVVCSALADWTDGGVPPGCAGIGDPPDCGNEN